MPREGLQTLSRCAPLDSTFKVLTEPQLSSTASICGKNGLTHSYSKPSEPGLCLLLREKVGGMKVFQGCQVRGCVL